MKKDAFEKIFDLIDKYIMTGDDDALAHAIHLSYKNYIYLDIADDYIQVEHMLIER